MNLQMIDVGKLGSEKLFISYTSVEDLLVDNQEVHVLYLHDEYACLIPRFGTKWMMIPRREISRENKDKIVVIVRNSCR